MLKPKTVIHNSKPQGLSQLSLLIVAVAILYRQVVPLVKLIADFPLNDFSVYLDGIRATIAGSNPYTQWFFDRYNYSPSTTLIFWPLILLPVNVSELVFTIISIVALWHTVSEILKLSMIQLTFPARLL